MLNEAPRLTAHGLRKFFISTVAENIGNLRVCALMEGHAAPMEMRDNLQYEVELAVKNVLRKHFEK